MYRVSQKKGGISECYSVCFTAHLLWSLEHPFLIHLKIEIHVLVARTKPFLSDIWELRNIYPICLFITFNCTAKSYEHVIPRIENIFLSSLISLRNGFVLATNTWISIFK